MNINIDNYEAYLLDYQDGNLNAEETAQLKAFVEAQGLDWAELTEEMPQLTAPAVVFEGKDSLKRKSKVIPLFVKIASAAAAALLFILVWRQNSRLPELEMMAELKPVGVDEIVAEKPALLAESQACFIVPKSTDRSEIKPSQHPVVSGKPVEVERVEAPLIAALQPKEAPGLSSQMLPSVLVSSDLMMPDWWADQRPSEEEDEPSMLRKGFLVMTDGQYDSFGEMLKESWRSVKSELAQLNETKKTIFAKKSELWN